MPEQERRPLGSGAVLLGGERSVSTSKPSSPQPAATGIAAAKKKYAEAGTGLVAIDCHLAIGRLVPCLTSVGGCNG